MTIRIQFDDGSTKEILARYFTVYTRQDDDAEPEIHVEDVDQGNHYYGLSIITSIIGIDRV